MTDPSPETGSQPATRTPEAEAQEVLMSALGGSPQGQGAGTPATDPSPGAGGTEAPAPLTGKVTVNWNGATREVDIDELVKHEIERGNLDTTREALQAELGKLGAYQALERVVSGWTPEQQQRFQEILQNPDRLSSSNGNGHSEEEDDLDVDMTRSSQPPPRQTQTHPEMEKVRQAIGYLLQREQTREETRQAQDREAQVTEKLNEFSVFKSNPGALPEARQSVIDHLIANPKANVDDAVARMATFTQGLLEKAGQRQPGPLAQPGGAPVPTWPQDLKVDPSRIGDRMLNGQSELDAERLFQDLISGRRPQV